MALDLVKLQHLVGDAFELFGSVFRRGAESSAEERASEEFGGDFRNYGGHYRWGEKLGIFRVTFDSSMARMKTTVSLHLGLGF